MSPQVAIVLTDAYKRIMWVNDGFTNLTGYEMAEVVGRSPGSILQGRQTEAEIVRKLRRSLERREAIKATITNYRKNGEEYPCRLVIHPIFDFDGNLTNFIAFEVDASVVPEERELPLLQLKEKYRTSSLDGLKEEDLFQRLDHLIMVNEVFLNPNLSLKEVSDLLHTNTKYLSQVINTRSGQNFHRYINEYRVNHLKEKLKDPNLRHLTLHGIALQCGFNSKSTFYKVFKEITGQTPKEYLEDKPELAE